MRHGSRMVLGLALLSLMTLPGGCASRTMVAETEPIPPEEPMPETAATSYAEVIEASVEGRPIVCRVVGDGAEAVLIMATIHGSEAAGTPLVQRLGDELMRRPDVLAGRRVVLLADANPDGHAAGTRGNANGVDLNRNFPAGNWRSRPRNGHEPLSEPESRVIMQLLERHEPARIVSIHQPIACVDYDGPAEALAAVVAEACRLPVRKLGGRPGSLGSYAGRDLGIPIITIELPGAASRLDEEELWRRYGGSLLAAITFPEAAEGPQARAASQKGDRWSRPCGGFVRFGGPGTLIP